MKSILYSLYTALSLYSVIPVPRTDWNRTNMRYSLCFVPVIGVVIGVATLLWYELCSRVGIAAPLYGAVAALLPIVISGGIHMDGFIDTADALSSHALTDQKLEILKDPHVGAFGVLYCAGQLLLSWALWQQLYMKPQLVALCALGYVASRACNALSVATFPTAKNSGLAHIFSDTAARNVVMVACICWAAVSFLGAMGVSLIWGGVMAAVAVVYLLLHRKFILWEFGGNTGDLAGFMLTNMEMLFLVVAVIGGLMA